MADDLQFKFSYLKPLVPGATYIQSREVFNPMMFTRMEHVCPVCGKELKNALEVLHHGVDDSKIEPLFFKDTVSDQDPGYSLAHRCALILLGCSLVKTMHLCCESGNTIKSKRKRRE